ncbi:MAG: hypothetical protein P0S95_06825 [Rhabdochlamydiaceae bacterium]|nr:hypothetical protein [Candidatus Amphrikana amoebophyrae]
MCNKLFESRYEPVWLSGISEVNKDPYFAKHYSPTIKGLEAIAKHYLDKYGFEIIVTTALRGRTIVQQRAEQKNALHLAYYCIAIAAMKGM